jgi:hypothetical protein
MNAIEQRILEALGDSAGASHWESLMALFRADREAFYLLACDGVRATAPARLVELAELARRVREAVRGSYQIDASEDGAHLVGLRGERAFIPPNLAAEVAAFLRAVDGKGARETPGKDYQGNAISEAEARFQLGDRATWDVEREILQERLDAKPLILRLDPADVSHLATQPRYVALGLKECARRVVLAPTHVFRDLKRGEASPDNLSEALAFCGKPRRAVDTSGQLVRPPEDMVFVVYADAEGYVFDWDWVEENPHEPGCPVDPEIRFGSPIDQLGRDASLELPTQLPDPQFDWTQACYSPRGDCIFCYIIDDVSYACRINPDLTVFRSLEDRQKITGFKIKNVRRILEEDKDIVLDDGENFVVSVESVLLAVLKGHKEAKVSVYAVCIGAFRKVDPPTVRVPKRPARRRELAPV